MLSRSLIPFFSVLFLTASVHAAELPPEASKHGWWWYEKEPQETQERQDTRRLPSLSEHTPGELWNMHPDDFQALLMAFQKKAVMAPTIENVREYYIVQDIARRKALAFANVAAAVIQKFPELSLEKDFPNAIPGKLAKVRRQSEELASKINQAKERFALVYFYSPSCGYCSEQSEILNFFVSKYRWQVRAVDISRNSSLAEMFHVRAVPYIMLIHKESEEFMPVAIGVVSLAQMEERVFRGIRLLEKEISPEEYSMYEFERGGGFDPGALLKVNEPYP
ncbi:conjugal transfer protein TraF [Candidatus Manganitrophus noduliformans]|uniref:Conjugal transfer protein TraF n=1 Tax=Candidatus Manganitrophus noduliformans TaxID=2606439 RepID=A0A7X6DQ26_9BACT|nr:conjugal transfer protein TraF [Candidatus Manganitrophus noduliformans]NKE71270.1 conjugal transfer protein TraF [Candidatus Manganitrophus noduliformans]